MSRAVDRLAGAIVAALEREAFPLVGLFGDALFDLVRDTIIEAIRDRELWAAE